MSIVLLFILCIKYSQQPEDRGNGDDNVHDVLIKDHIYDDI
jgi:hypothetical protein